MDQVHRKEAAAAAGSGHQRVRRFEVEQKRHRRKQYTRPESPQSSGVRHIGVWVYRHGSASPYMM
jgi:hypothetical protein